MRYCKKCGKPITRKSKSGLCKSCYWKGNKSGVKEIKYALVLFDRSLGPCHVCTSHINRTDGYPFLRRNGKTQRLHRYVYEQNFGQIPDGLFCLHKCDKKFCINPDHLYLGTQFDNMKDRFERSETGRKLSYKKAQEIRKLLDDGVNSRKVARKYNVTARTIRKIKSGVSWKCQ